MSGNTKRSGINNENDETDRGSRFTTAATAGSVVAGLAALAGGIYWLTKGKDSTEASQSHSASPPEKQKPKHKPRVPETNSNNNQTSSVTSSLLNLLSTMSTSSNCSSDKFSRCSPPRNPVITNLNGLLSDIHVRFIQLKNDDFQLHYNVFQKLFLHLHQKMKDVDDYYRKYSSTVQFAGSHFDNLRIKKPDEFDMDIVIGLPLNLSENSSNQAESDIIIEPVSAGFVQLKMGTQFQNLPMRDGIEWQNNKAAYHWKDGSNYLLRSKFLDWFKSVVNKALNTIPKNNNVPVYYIEGVEYTISKSESGPAMTLFIENRRSGFKLDVDLVPALKFPESRWPVNRNYRHIPRDCLKGEWMVVGKPNKAAPEHEQTRSWRIALHNQERGLLYNTHNLRQAIRLLKKLRDTLGMKKVASYYIKTLFFWEVIERNDREFWRQNPATLFTLMVKKLHAALVNGKIPYFWNKNNNLIGNVDQRILFEYAAKLVPLMQILDNVSSQNYKMVAKYLLTPEEMTQYKHIIE